MSRFAKISIEITPGDKKGISTEKVEAKITCPYLGGELVLRMQHHLTELAAELPDHVRKQISEAMMNTIMEKLAARAAA